MKLRKNTGNQKEVLAMLKDDENYYGEYGQQFLSNSDIGVLLSNPREYGVRRPDNKAFAMGRYFHQCFLEPDKAKVFPEIDVASRNTKVYKEAIESGGMEILLLTKEKAEIHEWVSTMRGNLHFFDNIYMEGNKFEVPAVQMIKGKPFKGKADIVSQDFCIDLKTSSNIMDFSWSARKYNYDSQCYIYQYLFGRPLFFYVIDKTTMTMGIFKPTEKFVRGGEAKVEKGIAIYELFFGENASEDVSNYFIEEDL